MNRAAVEVRAGHGVPPRRKKDWTRRVPTRTHREWEPDDLNYFHL